MISNSLVRIAFQHKQTQTLPWIGWAAFCLSLLWHGTIFHILSPTLTCPWVGDDANMQSNYLAQKTVGSHYSTEEKPIPAYLITSSTQSASTDIHTPSVRRDYRKVAPASELTEEKANTQTEDNHYIYELSAQAIGWKVSAPKIQYPTLTLSKQQQGTVILQASLNQKRGFDNINVLHSSGVSELDQAAIIWFKKVKLIPTQAFLPKLGTLFTQTIQFQLENKATG